MDSLELIAAYLNKPGPTDLVSIMKKLGIDYKEYDLGKISSFIQCTKDSCVVGVNKTLSLQKRRQAAAHEIAHFLLHRDLLEEHPLHTHYDSLWNTEDMSPYPLNENHDRQANRLAVQILMPLTKVKRLVKEGVDKPSALTRHFGVSEKVMQLRLESMV